MGFETVSNQNNRILLIIFIFLTYFYTFWSKLSFNCITINLFLTTLPIYPLLGNLMIYLRRFNYSR